MMSRLGLVLAMLLIPGVVLAQADTRQFYLSPIDGTGADATPFKSRCLGMAGAGNIDLRADATKAGGYMLCASNALPANQTGIILLGGSINGAMDAKTKTDLSTASKIAIKGGTVDEAIKEIVLPTLGLPKSGTYDIYLGKNAPSITVPATLSNDLYYKGPLLAFAQRGMLVAELAASALEVPLAWATSLSETFTASNGALAGCACTLTWANKSGTNWSIVSNQASQTTVGVNNSAYANSTLAGTDQEVGATLANSAETGGGFTRCGTIARTTNNATDTFYYFGADQENTGWELAKRVAGAFTSLATNTTDPAASNTFSVVASGTSISGKVNGSTLITPQTDNSISSGTYAGIYGHSSNVTFSCVLDGWSAADLAVSVPFGPLKRRAG